MQYQIEDDYIEKLTSNDEKSYAVYSKVPIRNNSINESFGRTDFHI
jgi:hypothetical protein